VKAIVTGATGYLGGRLVAALVAGGHDVVALVRDSSDTAGIETVLSPGRVLRLAEEPDAIEAAVSAAGADVAFHLAAAQQQGADADSVRALLETNVVFGGRFVAACAASGVSAFVSAGTYSTHATGTAEYVPASFYAATKRAFEDVQAYYAATTPLRCATLELTDTYGPDDPRSKFLRLVAQASAGGTTLRATLGEQRLSLVHADDVAGAFIHAGAGLLGGTVAPGTYSVAAEETLTLREIVGVWRDATGRDVDVAWGDRPYPANQIMHPYVEHRLPGWTPAIGLREGLARVYGPHAS